MRKEVTFQLLNEVLSLCSIVDTIVYQIHPYRYSWIIRVLADEVNKIDWSVL
jgi:hypothetical protein